MEVSAVRPQSPVATSTAPTLIQEAPTGFLARLNDLPLQRKLMLGGGIAAVLAIIVATILWSQQADYKVLYANLSDKDGGAVLAQLSQMNIPYKHADGGNAILLSSHHFGEIDRVCDRLVFISGGEKLSEESPESIAERARGLASLEYPDLPTAESAHAAISELGLAAEERGARLLVRLGDDDPQAALARLLAASHLPAPTSVVYGKLPLADLYRELYGGDAC